MSPLNYDNDWPTVLSSSDTRLMEYKEVQELEVKNKDLTIGLIVLAAVLIGIVLAANYQHKQESKREK